MATFETLYLFDQLDFQGKSVIDIGCWDGYFSFQAERRGASLVVGFDDPSYRWGGMDGFVREKSLSSPADPPAPARDRSAIMYKRSTEQEPQFSGYCFSTPPTLLED
ncbi:MAG: hypothetical protein ACI97A_002115 [Planctomycetota bacterium]